MSAKPKPTAWYSIGHWDQPVLFTSIEAAFYKSIYARELSPKVCYGFGFKAVRCEFFFPTEDTRMLKRLVESPGWLSRFIRTHRKATQTYARLSKEHAWPNVENDAQARELFELYVGATGDFAYFLDACWILDQKILMKKLLKTFDADTIMRLVAAQERSDLNHELAGLRRIRQKLAKRFGARFASMSPASILKTLNTKNALRRELETHASQYSYLSMQLFRGTPWTLGDYIGRSQSLRDSAQKAPLPRPRVHMDAKTQKLVRHVRILNEMRASRIEYFNKWIWQLMPLWRYLMRRLNVSLDELTALSWREIIQSLDRDARLPVSRKELAKRAVSYSSRFRNGEYSYHSAPPAKEKRISAKEVKGMVANAGRATGTVRIIHGADDFRIFKKGDILVASQTTPNFIAIMLKARAIVTNQGGVTSHAAIVSRELGIPCVIGTKIATQVFKDGDRVEVDAEKGVVRKLH